MMRGNFSNRLGLLTVCFGAVLVLAGCRRSVELIFSNGTDQRLSRVSANYEPERGSPLFVEAGSVGADCFRRTVVPWPRAAGMQVTWQESDGTVYGAEVPVGDYVGRMSHRSHLVVQFLGGREIVFHVMKPGTFWAPRMVDHPQVTLTGQVLPAAPWPAPKDFATSPAATRPGGG